jgi:hypothetical protein
MRRRSMTVETQTAFQIDPIAPDVLRRIRLQGVDDFGNVLKPFTEAGEPLRCCLRNSREGERIAAIKYAPFDWDGPYAETGPVFIHVDECEGYDQTDAFPEAFRSRPRILRAYGHDRTILDSSVIEDGKIEAAIEELLAREDVDFLHARNVAYGCYMFSIRRQA